MAARVAVLDDYQGVAQQHLAGAGLNGLEIDAIRDQLAGGYHRYVDKCVLS